MALCIIKLVVFNLAFITAQFYPRVTQQLMETTTPATYYPKANPADIEDIDLFEAKRYFDQFNNFYFNSYQNDQLKAESFKTFEDNVKRILIMNKFTSSARFRINEFTHRTLEDFTELYTGFNDTGIDNSKVSDFAYNSGFGTAPPPALDWRGLGLSTTIKNQGPCKMSYVTSAIANIEAQYARKFNTLPVLSHRQGYSCERQGDCQYGGLPHLVMEALMMVGGVIEESKYSNHRPEFEKVCFANESLIKVKINGVIRLKVATEESIIAALVLYGPLVTSIFVSESIKNYHSGILNPSDCDEKPNHAVLLVGYGTSGDKIPYWIIKNSWGKNWGEAGYLRLIRGERACNIGYYLATTVVDVYQKPKVFTTPLVLPPHLQLPVFKERELVFKGDQTIDSMDFHSLQESNAIRSNRTQSNATQVTTTAATLPADADYSEEVIWPSDYSHISPLNHESVGKMGAQAEPQAQAEAQAPAEAQAQDKIVADTDSDSSEETKEDSSDKYRITRGMVAIK